MIALLIGQPIIYASGVNSLTVHVANTIHMPELSRDSNMAAWYEIFRTADTNIVNRVICLINDLFKQKTYIFAHKSMIELIGFLCSFLTNLLRKEYK